MSIDLIKILVSILVALAFGFTAYAQSSETKVAESSLISEPSELDRKADFNRFRVSENSIFGSFVPFENLKPDVLLTQKREINDFTEKLYRKPKDKELRELQPDSALLAQYRDFLKNRKTGLVVMLPEQGCAENAAVFVASKHCLKYNFPGAGSSISFREVTYRIPHLADFTFDGTSLVSRGEFANSVFAVLGDIPLENVKLNSRELKGLVDLKPAENLTEARKIQESIFQGFTREGIPHGSGVIVKQNTTYAARLIAYRGSYLRSTNGIVYNELNFDDRRDILVIFRVVAGNVNAPISLLFQIIADQKSPRLETPDDKDANIERIGKDRSF